MNAAWQHTAVALAAAGVWLAVYRLPLAAPRRRQRFRLWASTATGLPPNLVFPLFGTAVYLLGGLAASAAVMGVSGIGLGDLLPVAAGWDAIPPTALAILGAAALTAFAMSVVLAVRPTVDIAAAVSSVEWIGQVMVLPARWRWLVPAASAAVEEFFFRGVLCGGLLLAGAPAWTAIAVAGAAFTLAQVLLTERALQALVLAVSSAVLSVVGGLLLVVTGSVLPAIVTHAAFAAFYAGGSGSSASSAGRGARPATSTRSIR